MISTAQGKRVSLRDTQRLTRDPGNLLTRKIWLPKFLYELLPYFYVTAGFAAFLATIYISEWFWVLPHYLLFSAASDLRLDESISIRNRIARDVGSIPHVR